MYISSLVKLTGMIHVSTALAIPAVPSSVWKRRGTRGVWEETVTAEVERSKLASASSGWTLPEPGRVPWYLFSDLRAAGILRYGSSS